MEMLGDCHTSMYVMNIRQWVKTSCHESKKHNFQTLWLYSR